MWLCQDSSDLTGCDTGRFLIKLSVFELVQPSADLRKPEQGRFFIKLSVFCGECQTGRDPEWNRARPGMERPN